MFWILVIVTICAFVLFIRAKGSDSAPKRPSTTQKSSISTQQPSTNYFESLDKREEERAQREAEEKEEIPADADVTTETAEQIEDWKKAAEQDGDTKAMICLGRHYQSLDTFDDCEEAAKWYDRAAEAGSFQGMYFSMLVHSVLALVDQEPNVGGWADALETWEKVDRYATTIIGCFKDGIFTMDMNGAQEILDNAHKCKNDAEYGMCISYYQMDDRTTIIGILRNKTTTRESILCGLCMARNLKSKREFASFFSQACEKLALVEADETYRLAKKGGVEQYVYASAALYLALAYREGMSVTKDCNRSYAILHCTYNAVSDQDAKRIIAEELKRYEKKTLGNYTYH